MTVPAQWQGCYASLPEDTLTINPCMALLVLILVLGVRTDVGQATPVLPYQDPNQAVDIRVNDLLQRMALEEKVYQMCALCIGDGDEVFKTSALLCHRGQDGPLRGK